MSVRPNSRIPDTTTMNIIATEKFSDTFLSILDDKNKLIGILQQQLENQKLQILYYLKKEISYTTVNKLSRTCTIEKTQSIPVTMALEHFKKENGIESNLFRLYDYMRHVDEKLTKTLNCQEFILRKIVEKLCQAVRGPRKFHGEMQPKAVVKQALCLDLFNALLDATVGLRKKLDTFRICCNRLIVIEDERNNLVEQVVSLPAEKKLNCNFLISIKEERMEIEQKMKEIRQQQELQRSDINKLHAIKGNISSLHKQLEYSIKDVGDLSDVNVLVNDLNSQAKSLLDVSEKRNRKSFNNTNKSTVINLIKTAIRGGEFKTNDLEESELYRKIKKELDIANAKLKDEVLVLTTENECLRCRMKTCSLEKNELKMLKSELQARLKEMQKNYEADKSILMKQRDAYKAQLDDLEIIRETYTNYLTNPNAADSNKEIELTKTVKHLDKKVRLMKEIINKQNKEIVLQGEFIDNLKTYYGTRRRCELDAGTSRPESATSKEESAAATIKSDDSDDKVLKEVIACQTRDKQPRKTLHTIHSSPVDTLKNNGMVKEIIQTVINDVKSSNKKSSNLSSSFSLEIKCSSKKGHPRSQQCTCNELELMKDCSQESLPVFCPPIRRNNDHGISNKNSYSTKSKYSRNIEVLVHNNKLNSSSEEYNNIFKMTD